MIKLLRVDDRLIHGQVAVSWTSYLDADTIVVANDNAVKNKMMQMAFNLAKPPQITLSIKSLDGAVAVINNPKYESRKIFVVTASIADALYLAERCKSLDNINLGGIRKSEGKKQIERQIFLDEKDIDGLKRLYELGRHIELQSVPTEKRLGYEEILKIFK